MKQPASRGRGEANSQAVLTERDVKAIRLLYREKLYGPTELARLFQVSRESIHKIVRGKTWRHVI